MAMVEQGPNHAKVTCTDGESAVPISVVDEAVRALSKRTRLTAIVRHLESHNPDHRDPTVTHMEEQPQTLQLLPIGITD